MLGGCTVKRVDEVVRHLHLVTQDQNTQVLNKVSDIHVENSIINIFRHFSQVIELVRYDYISHVELIVCKCRTSSTELEFFKSSMPAWARTCNLHIHNLVLYHSATLSSLFKSTLKDRKGAEELYLCS
jgi:hypothetical protein